MSHRALRLGVAALGFAAALWLVTDATRARPTAGLWRATAAGTTCEDPEWAHTAERTLVPEPFHGERVTVTRCDRYRGYLVVHGRSRLSIELHASGDTRVLLGKQQLVALDAGAVRVTRRAERILEPGAHFLEVRAVQSAPLAYLRLSAELEPEEAGEDTPLGERALRPLDLDSLAPSPVDAARMLAAPPLTRRAPERLAGFLVSLATAALALGARSPRRGMAWLGLLTLAAALLALAPERSFDPHSLSHGARAWRTLWHSSPGVFADAIPALGIEPWLLGAAWTVGGEGGPRVLAVALGALELAWLTATAERVAGIDAARACAILGVVTIGIRGVDTDPLPALFALGCWLAASSQRRVLGRIARASSPVPRESVLSHARATTSRRTLATLGGLGAAAVALGAAGFGAPRLAGTIALLVVLLGAAIARVLGAAPRAPAPQP
ncbi:MAG: hypothetical protein OHK0013_18730 [Sandaracinaceae bacterium]